MMECEKEDDEQESRKVGLVGRQVEKLLDNDNKLKNVLEG